MLPLNLHVLSLPLAFILSQDQTLHTFSLVLLLDPPLLSLLLNSSSPYSSHLLNLLPSYFF